VGLQPKVVSAWSALFELIIFKYVNKLTNWQVEIFDSAGPTFQEFSANVLFGTTKILAIKNKTTKRGIDNKIIFFIWFLKVIALILLNRTKTIISHPNKNRPLCSERF